MKESNDKSIMNGLIKELLKNVGLDQPLDKQLTDAFDHSVVEVAEGAGVKDIEDVRSNILIELNRIDNEEMKGAVLANLIAYLPFDTQMALIAKHMEMLNMYMMMKLKESKDPVAQMLLAASRLQDIAKKELGEQE